LGQRFLAQVPANLADPYSSAFNIVPWSPWAVLGGFIVVMLGATVLVQKRKDIL
jgi:hypothetical protein